MKSQTNRRPWKFNAQQWRHRIKIFAAQTFWGYDKADLVRALRRMGVQEGDALMVHCGWHATSGFRGTIDDFIDALMETVGPSGTLAMMSMAYQGMSSHEYLQKGKPFDVRRSVSMVGLPTEIFRRRAGVIRGLHPTHSVAAWGAKAEWLIAGQGQELSPFGEQSPFARLVELDGKILLYDVPFNTMTFEHHLEHLIQQHLPFNLYNEEPVMGVVIDREGKRHEVATLVLNKKISEIRHSEILEAELKNTGVLQRHRIGRSDLMLANARTMASTVQAMIRQDRGFHLA